MAVDSKILVYPLFFIPKICAFSKHGKNKTGYRGVQYRPGNKAGIIGWK